MSNTQFVILLAFLWNAMVFGVTMYLAVTYSLWWLVMLPFVMTHLESIDKEKL